MVLRKWRLHRYPKTLPERKRVWGFTCDSSVEYTNKMWQNTKEVAQAGRNLQDLKCDLVLQFLLQKSEIRPNQMQLPLTKLPTAIYCY